MSEGLDGQPAMDWRAFEPDLKRLCAVKAEEFRFLGYAEVSADEIWNCVRSTHRGGTSLHELVAAVMGLQVGTFMNFTTVNAFKGVFDGSSDRRRF